MEYRHEYKYIVSETQLNSIENKINVICDYDSHMNSRLFYNVRSMYFDDYQDSFLNDNESGTDERIKFRIRMYGCSENTINLEIKYKKSGMTKKEAVRINAAMISKVMNGSISLEDIDSDVWRKFFYYWNTRGLKPKIVIEYDRRAFVYDSGNVRITFDKYIRAGDAIRDLSNPDMETVPILPQGIHVLEVKYDEFLPDYISECFDGEVVQRVAFSKYYLGREVLKRFERSRYN